MLDCHRWAENGSSVDSALQEDPRGEESRTESPNPASLIRTKPNDRFIPAAGSYDDDGDCRDAATTESPFSVESAEKMLRRKGSFDPDRDLPESWTKKYLSRLRLCRSPSPSPPPSSYSSADGDGDDRDREGDGVVYGGSPRVVPPTAKAMMTLTAAVDIDDDDDDDYRSSNVADNVYSTEIRSRNDGRPRREPWEEDPGRHVPRSSNSPGEGSCCSAAVTDANIRRVPSHDLAPGSSFERNSSFVSNIAQTTRSSGSSKSAAEPGSAGNLDDGKIASKRRRRRLPDLPDKPRSHNRGGPWQSHSQSENDHDRSAVTAGGTSFCCSSPTQVAGTHHPDVRPLPGTQRRPSSPAQHSEDGNKEGASIRGETVSPSTTYSFPGTSAREIGADPTPASSSAGVDPRSETPSTSSTCPSSMPSSPSSSTSNSAGGVESFIGGPELIQLYYNGYPRPVLVLRCQHCHPQGGYGSSCQTSKRKSTTEKRTSRRTTSESESSSNLQAAGRTPHSSLLHSASTRIPVMNDGNSRKKERVGDEAENDGEDEGRRPDGSGTTNHPVISRQHPESESQVRSSDSFRRDAVPSAGEDVEDPRRPPLVAVARRKPSSSSNVKAVLAVVEDPRSSTETGAEDKNNNNPAVGGDGDEEGRRSDGGLTNRKRRMTAAGRLPESQSEDPLPGTPAGVPRVAGSNWEAEDEVDAFCDDQMVPERPSDALRPHIGNGSPAVSRPGSAAGCDTSSTTSGFSSGGGSTPSTTAAEVASNDGQQDPPPPPSSCWTAGGIFSWLSRWDNVSTHLDSLEPTHRGLHRFHPRHDDELEVDIGDPIYVVKEAEDLWCEGVNLRTGKQGIFPAAHAVDLDYSDFDPMGPGDDEARPSEKERFLAKYLGSVETTADRGDHVVVQSVAKVNRMLRETRQRQQQQLQHRSGRTTTTAGILGGDPFSTLRKNDRGIPNNNNNDDDGDNDNVAGGNDDDDDDNNNNNGGASNDETATAVDSPGSDAAYHQRTCVLEISDSGIRMVGNKRGTTNEIEDYFYPLANISYCGVNPEDPKSVGVITKHPTLSKFACHIFLLETSARPLASAVGHAFERFYQKVLENAFPVEEFYLE